MYTLRVCTAVIVALGFSCVPCSAQGGVVFSNDGCDAGNGWNVTGNLNLDGSFTVSATTGEPLCGVNVWSYTGNITGIGCSSGSGEWANDASVTGTWFWSKPCDAPDVADYGISPFGWDPTNPTEYIWLVTEVSYNGFTYGGREVAESDGGGGTDSCYWDFGNGNKSVIPQALTVPYTPAVVNWNEQTKDTIGWTPQAVSYYRNTRALCNLPMPCGFRHNQRLSITCDDGSPIFYQQNAIGRRYRRF